MLCFEHLAVPMILTTYGSPPNPNQTMQNGDIYKIKHIIIIMQENRSFDSYSGTYPGVDGFLAKMAYRPCVSPIHNPATVSSPITTPTR